MSSNISAPAPRERLLDAAEALINASGIHATGVDAIVRSAGAARKSFYQYFASKDALVAAALSRRDERWMQWFEAGTRRAAPTPAGQLLGLFGVLREWFVRGDFHGCAFLNAAGEIKQHEHDAFRIAQHHKARLLAFVAALCREAGVREPDALARQWLILIDGAISVALVTGQAQAADDARRAARALLASAGVAAP